VTHDCDSGLCGRRRAEEMKRVAAMLDNAIHIRDLTSLEYSLALHVRQERLGWPGLWCLLPQWAKRAHAVQRSVAAEQSMTAQVRCALIDHNGEWFHGEYSNRILRGGFFLMRLFSFLKVYYSTVAFNVGYYFLALYFLSLL